MLDTLKAADELQKAGFELRQAEAIAHLLLMATSGAPASRTDLKTLSADLRAEFARTRAELREELGRLRIEVKEEIARFRSEIKGELAGVRSGIGE